MTSTISKKINFKEIENKAYNFLYNYSNGTLPIDLKGIINRIHNLKIMKYSMFAKMHNLNHEETCRMLNSEDGALWYHESLHLYILLYNEKISSKERIRFTIAHELGHYVLRHNELTNKTVFSRYKLTDEEYSTFETEANFFAKHLLVPFPILNQYTLFFKKMDTSFIKDTFNVSHTVSSNVIDHLNSMHQFGVTNSNHIIEGLFLKYITTDKTTCICTTCCARISRDSVFCSICSTKQSKKRNTIMSFLQNKKFEKNNKMKYKKIKLNDNFYPIQCPKCENEEIENSYCTVCGVYLNNICLGKNAKLFDSFGNPIAIENFLENGCHKKLDGNARYCSDCGGMSSFFFQGLLSHWENEKNQKTELPF